MLLRAGSASPTMTPPSLPLRAPRRCRLRPWHPSAPSLPPATMNLSLPRRAPRRRRLRLLEYLASHCVPCDEASIPSFLRWAPRRHHLRGTATMCDTSRAPPSPSSCGPSSVDLTARYRHIFTCSCGCLQPPGQVAELLKGIDFYVFSLAIHWRWSVGRCVLNVKDYPFSATLGINFCDLWPS